MPKHFVAYLYPALSGAPSGAAWGRHSTRGPDHQHVGTRWRCAWPVSSPTGLLSQPQDPGSDRP